MVLGGPNITMQFSNMIEAQTTLTLAQLVIFNMIKRRSKGTTSSYHSTDREPPLPIYLGLMLHAETRKRDLIDKLYGLGLSVSYDRVLALSTEMGNKACAQFESDCVVCPIRLRKGVFTTAAVDNIDHNPSSTTAHGSFHGTGISLFQHPTPRSPGEERCASNENSTITSTKRLAPLPEFYSNVKPVILPKSDPPIPKRGQFVNACQSIQDAIQEEYKWLDNVKEEMTKEIVGERTNVSWAAFHANRVPSTSDFHLSTSALLPLFKEEAASAAMICHAVDVVIQAVKHLNPGQVPVLACDQPLYAIAKKIQWTWPEKYGEDKLFIMLGGLHTELAALKAIGHWLEDSGWDQALAQSGVTTPGTAESFLKAAHISRTRHAHQLTASALYTLMTDAYEKYTTSVSDVQLLTFNEWRKRQEEEHPQFHFWSLTLDFELAILVLVRSLRESNFQLYMEACRALVPWFFALNHTNYARWLPIHIRDMASLDQLTPSLVSEFKNGHFVVKKSHRHFSAVPIDQAHEQNNKVVKGDGGAIGLTKDYAKLLRWMISGPEVSRVISDFQASQELLKRKQSKGPDILHHEETKAMQTAFHKQVKALHATITEMGNPFKEASQDLLVLNSRDMIDPSVVATVRSIQKLGQEQYDKFVVERLEKGTASVYDPIKRNKLSLFSCPRTNEKPKEKMQIASLKEDCSLFSRLYVSCQVRDGNLEEFFAHENQCFPPSLSHFGKIRHGTKSDLVACIERVKGVQYATEAPSVDGVMLDGAALINMLVPGLSKTFQQYSDHVFLPYIRNKAEGAQRVDVVWDRYFSHSLKATARKRRGKGIRRRVKPDTKIPGNWAPFLREEDNKEELFSFLADELIRLQPEDGVIVTTKGEKVLCNKTRDLSMLSPCNHEEADTRLLLHAADCARLCPKVLIRTVDTDVVVIATALFHELSLTELWVALGVGKHLRYLPIHAISKSLGTDRSKALLLFHAFTGCDQTSAFASKGKKTAWETWCNFNDITEVFKQLGENPTLVALQNATPLLERFVVLMYDRTSSCTRVNEARKDLFTRKGRSLELIPPTSDALFHHMKRSVFQAGHVWGKSLVPCYVLPCPSDWGWKRTSTQEWEPVWTALPQASQSCQELLKCGFKSEKGCTGRCKCVRAEMLCTALCMCGGLCHRE